MSLIPNEWQTNKLQSSCAFLSNIRVEMRKSPLDKLATMKTSLTVSQDKQFIYNKIICLICCICYKLSAKFECSQKEYNELVYS